MRACRLGQLFPQQPDRARVGNTIRETKPEEPQNDSRLLIGNSTRSSDSALAAWIKRNLNIITGSND
jgi:hypothetical protein